MEELQRIRLPNWAVKPQHRQTVVATNKGWIVRETGEILKRVNDLPRKLELLKQHMDEVMVATFAPIDVEPSENVLDEVLSDGSVTNTDVAEDALEQFVEALNETNEDGLVNLSIDVTVINTDIQPKKRGRKPGPKKKVDSGKTETDEETNS